MDVNEMILQVCLNTHLPYVLHVERHSVHKAILFKATRLSEMRDNICSPSMH